MKKSPENLSTHFCKGFLCLLILLISPEFLFSQNVGISPAGATPPNAAAGVDVNYTSKGLLIPRVALESTSSFVPLSSHVAGMLVYNTATAGDVTPGFYFNNGISWLRSMPKANAAGEMQFWNLTYWVTIPIGMPGQVLQQNVSGIPSWSASSLATITTKQLTAITSTSAGSGGIVLNDGGSPVSAYGVCWAITSNPTIADNITTDGAGIGSFSSSITGLITGTTYFVRSFATTGSGTAYGNELNFSTP